MDESIREVVLSLVKYNTIIETNENIYSKEYMDKLDKIENFGKETDFLTMCVSDMLADDICNSLRIEGNELQKTEMVKFFEDDITIRGKSLRSFIQVRDYTHLTQKLFSDIKNIKVDADFICYVHRLVTEGELIDTESGVFRNDAVFLNVVNTRYTPPDAEQVPELVQQLLINYYENTDQPAFERVCEFKRNFERIHPFFDGNGRVGRLIMNLLFLQNNLPCIIVPVEQRDAYFNALENNTFCEFAADLMLTAIFNITRINSSSVKFTEYFYGGEQNDGHTI